MEEKQKTDVYSALTKIMAVMVSRRTRLNTGIRMHSEHKSYLFTRGLELLKSSDRLKPERNEEKELLNFTPLCYEDGTEYDLGVFLKEASRLLEREIMFKKDKDRLHLPEVLQACSSASCVRSRDSCRSVARWNSPADPATST